MGHTVRWVVDQEAGQHLGALLEEMGIAEKALQDGRVFVDRVRVTEPMFPLRLGGVVEVYPAPTPTSAEGAVCVLGQKQGVVAVDKPCGISTIPDQRGAAASVQGLVAQALGIADPARLHPVSRLDREVSGVVMFALTRSARIALQEARTRGDVQRHYVALAAEAPTPTSGVVDVPIGRGVRGARKVRGSKAVPSQSRYATIARGDRGVLLSIEPITGRTHQIRVHMAHLGAPLWGDSKYGGPATIVQPSGAVTPVTRIALHAAWVSLRLTPRDKPWVVNASRAADLEALWVELGGDAAAWEAAMASM